MSLTHQVAEFMSNSPSFGYWMTFFLSMIESIAVLGSLIPGAITMTAAGTLIGTGILSFTIAMPLAMTGALVGDYFSYWIGLKYQSKLSQMWPISRYPHWIEKGNRFFSKHGVWALVIGRFFGPARSMIPLIAGMLNMPPRQFCIGIVPSAILWSLVYLTPGILIGAISASFPSHLAIEILIEGCILVIAFWAIFSLFTSASSLFSTCIDDLSYSFTTLTNGVSNMQSWQNKHLSSPQLASSNAVKSLVFTIVFFWMCFSSHTQGLLTRLDDYAYAFILSFSNEFTFITSAALAVLGYYKTFILAAVFLALLACYKKQFFRAFCIVGSTLIAVAFIKLSKHGVGHLRPEAIRDIVTTYSFPSGHTGITAAFLFFFSILFKEHPKSHLITAFTWFMVILMAISRMLLGVHWLSDVIGGATLGLASAHMAAAIFYCKKSPIDDSKQLFWVMIISVVCAWGIMMPSSYPYTIKQLTRSENIIGLDQQQWMSMSTTLPFYRDNRLGIPSSPLNIQTNQSLSEIRQSLESNGWDSYPTADSISSVILRHQQEHAHMPLFNLLHNNQAPALIMVNQETPPVVLRLWKSGFATQNHEVLIGTVNQIRPGYHKFLPQLRYKRWKDFRDGITTLKKDLNGESVIHTAPESNIANALHWNRQVLLLGR